MAVRDLRARIGIDGEDQYKQVLQELNSGNRVLASEMKKLQAEFKGNTESVEYLTQKGDLLERELLTQRDKVDTLRQAVQQATEQFGEGSEETQNWIVKLNNAEATEADLEHAVEDNNRELENQGKVMNKLIGSAESLADQLGIQLPSGARKALDAMKTMSNGTVLAMTAAGGAITGIIKGVKDLHEITMQAAHDADDIITKSMITGLSTTTIQQLKYAENLIDVSYSTISGSLTKLTKNMAAAQKGNESLSSGFAQLGVSITDSNGNLRRAEDVFYDMIDALGQVENATERDAISMELMGKSAQDLNPLILQGSDALKQLSAEAEAAGYVLDESQIAKLGEVDDAYQRMQLDIEATKKQLAVEFAPASKTAMELYAQVVGSAGQSLAKSGIITGMASILESIGGIFTDTKKLSGDAIPEATEKMNVLTVSLGAVAQLMAVISDAANLITGIVTLDWNKVKTAMGFGYSSGNASNLQRVMMQQEGRWEQYSSYYNPVNPYADSSRYGYDSLTGQYFDRATGNYMYGNNATGNDNWRGGLTWVGENGPELVALPGGTQILSNQESRQALGGDTYIFNIDAKTTREYNDLVEMAQGFRVRQRMRG